MANYIVLRLTPPTAVDAGTFTTYLNNLTVTVFDISYAQPTAGVLIGSAAFVPPAFPPPAGTRIAQFQILAGLQSVATAVIEYIPPDPEYVTPDLRIELDWGGPRPLNVSQLYYDVVLYNRPGPFPLPATFQGIPDASVSAFVTLPPPTTLLTLPNDNTPPNFDDLLAAVTAVLAADPALPITPALLGNLSTQQCENVANEIIYGPQAPLPTPPEPLEDLYTNPPNTGTFSDTREQDRQQFEGLLASYYSTHSATALRLTNYIFALSVAYWLQAQVQNAAQALLTFPVNPNAPPSPFTTVSDAQVIFTGAPNLGLDMPPDYFYALTYDLSANTTRQLWQSTVFGADPQSNLNRLIKSINSNLISLVPAINPAQAVRLIAALNIPATTTVPQWPVTFPAANQIFNMDWRAFPPLATWRGYQPADEFAFWQNEATTQPLDFLRLVLWALTQGFMVGATPLARLVRLDLLPTGPMTTVSDLSTATPANWQAFFTADPAALPPFTEPGTVPGRIAAFIQWVQKFFQLTADTPLLNPVTTTAPPRFGVPSYDLIAQTIADYPGFVLGMVINLATLEAAANAAIPGDEAAQAWAVQAVETLNELFILAQIPGETPAFDFSVMEALFARGFTSREEVLDLPFPDFQQALIGTIAYDHAAAVYANAGPPHAFPPPPGGPFVPINPGGLTDCIPPLEFSPLGPVAYLHEMLKVSERSTCDHPFAPPAPGHTTLQTVIDGRRGPVETLFVNRANLETPLPLIDIANECLELMASKSPPASPGAVYNTSEHHLGPFKLCDDDCENGSDYHDCACEPDDCDCHGEHRTHRECHKPAAIFGALPEYSTPAPPVAANSAVVPAVWNKLKADFACCCLPYDQALDVNRTYLAYLRSCRFETMRTFRKCITEFVLDPVNPPADFQTYLWRYPARLDIAIEYLGLSPEEYETLFKGVMPAPCDAQDIVRPPPTGVALPVGGPVLPEECLREAIGRRGIIRLPDFLKCTCLTYCEFYELWRCGPFPFHNGHDHHGFPECEPCCLDDLWVRLPEGNPDDWIGKIAIFVRLWHKLQHLCGAGYTFCELADICSVLNFSSPDFIRQLAAFQMLRDQFRLPLTGTEEPAMGATGADRTFLLALWVGPTAKHWHWALHHLLEGIAKHAECHHECERRGPEFIKLLADNLDPLSRLAGFDPATPAFTWHFAPTHTLRFAEILAKIYASNFSVGEVLYLFTPDTHLDGDDPFPMQPPNEAEHLPLDLPDDAHRHALWELRHKLLRVHPGEEQVRDWTWHRDRVRAHP